MKNVRLRVPIVGLALGALLLYALAQFTARQDVESQDIIQAAEHAIAAGKAWRARQAKLAAIAQAATQSGRTWRAKAEAAASAAVQLEAVLAQATTAPESIGVLVHQVEFYRGQALAWAESSHAFERAWLADSTRADLAEGRVATLEQHLAHVLTVADCHILGAKFLPRCPSRTVSAALGAGAAVVVVVATRH